MEKQEEAQLPTSSHFTPETQNYGPDPTTLTTWLGKDTSTGYWEALRQEKVRPRCCEGEQSLSGQVETDP